MTLDLAIASDDFCQTTENLLNCVLPRGHDENQSNRRITVHFKDRRYVVRTGSEERAGGVELFSGGSHVGNLQVIYYCDLDQANEYLAVRKSMFQLISVSEATPLFRLDFNQKAHTVPAAHWNVHGERQATSHLLAQCNPDHSGRLSNIHLPVGGVRHRPCLEDFLELLIAEFKIDCQPGWQSVIEEGRERWREFQIKTLARDFPNAAASVLVEIGYEIFQPANGQPSPNMTMLRCR